MFNVFSDLQAGGSIVLLLKHFHLYTFLFFFFFKLSLVSSALEIKHHYLATHASPHSIHTFYQMTCSPPPKIFRRKDFVHGFSSL